MSDPKNPSDLRPELGSNSYPNEEGGNHETIFDTLRKQHMSWDTDAEGYEIPGSSHIRDDVSHKTTWRPD